MVMCVRVVEMDSGRKEDRLTSRAPLLALLPSFRVYLSASSKDEGNIPGVIAACPSLWDAPAVFFPFGLCGIRSSITTSFHFIPRIRFGSKVFVRLEKKM